MSLRGSMGSVLGGKPLRRPSIRKRRRHLHPSFGPRAAIRQGRAWASRQQSAVPPIHFLSGGCAAGGGSRAHERGLGRRRISERLQHHAIALGELHEGVELVLGRVGVEFERKADGLEPDRGLLVEAERAAKVDVALRLDLARAQLDPHRGRDRLHGHAGAGDQRLEQHVAGAELGAAPPGRRMKPRDGERASGLDLTGNGGIECAAGYQRHQRRLRVGAIAVLERRLDRAQFVGVHGHASPVPSLEPPSGPVQSNLSGASRNANRSRWAATTPFSRSTSSLFSPSIVTSSASAPASSVTRAPGNLTTPLRSESSTSSLWLQCLQSCWTYLAALAVGALALAIGMGGLSVFKAAGAPIWLAL